MQDYTGVREVTIKDDDLQAFYEDGREYKFLTNEYVKVRNEQGEVIYLGKWNGEKFEQLKYKKIDSDYFGVISPLNDEQRFWFDCLQNDNILIKVCLSKFGAGKTMTSLCWAFTEINSKKSKYKCLRYVRNNLECKDMVGLGALPGNLSEKLRPWALEISDILGGEDMMDIYVEQNKIRLESVGYCRGRSWEGSIIFIEEIQNFSPYLLSLVQSRCGRNSCIIGVGDIRQTDKETFSKNSGILKAIEKFKGNPLFGMVTLQKNERSEVSTLADLLLE